MRFSDYTVLEDKAIYSVVITLVCIILEKGDGSQCGMELVTRNHALEIQQSLMAFILLYSSWSWCGGEVFQVFAKGKANGATITDQDTLAFFYPCGYKFVSFQANQMLLSVCINSCPPSSAHFDRCTAETVEITILD